MPRGGRTIFPKYQLVGYVGFPGSAALGPLDKDLDAKAARLEMLAKSYAYGRTPQPVMELIVVIAKANPGKDRMYRGWLEDTKIQEYLDAARKHRALLLLDVQPGRANIVTEVKRLEKALKQHPGVVMIKSVDGIGHRKNKESTWGKLTTTLAPGVHTGFKLFYKEDARHGPLMTPQQVISLKPRPELVVHE